MEGITTMCKQPVTQSPVAETSEAELSEPCSKPGCPSGPALDGGSSGFSECQQLKGILVKLREFIKWM